MKKTWNQQELVNIFEAHRNEELAGPMEAYMKNNFPFLGIKSPLRTQLLRDFFAEYALPNHEQLFVEAWKLYERPEREYHYAAIALMEKMKKTLTCDDLSILRKFIETNSWWDSIDAIAPKLVGHVVKLDRAHGEMVMREWAASDNFWTNRAAILHQLKFKDETDAQLLFEFIERHMDSREFFIRKAIGWALREYAKTNPTAVLAFVEEQPLQPLSRREALKHIGQKGK